MKNRQLNAVCNILCGEKIILKIKIKTCKEAEHNEGITVLKKHEVFRGGRIGSLGLANANYYI